MAMDLGDAKLTIKVDDKGFNASMNRIGRNADAMGKKFRTMGKVMIGVGIAIAGALTAAVYSYAKAGDEVHKMALRTGFATEALSELRHVAMLTGTELGSIEKATKKMSKTIVDASEGMTTYIRAFDRIGLSAEALLKLSPEEQFFTIAKAIGDLEDPTIKAATAVDIFGRAGTMLLPMLDAGSAGIEAMRQEAHELGIIFDVEAAAKAAALTDAMGRLKESFQGVGFALAETLVPIITEFLEDKLIPTITRIKDWIAANEGVAKTMAVIAGVLTVGGAFLLGLSLVAKAIMAINAALIVMHALMGPAGWAKLAVGLGVAAGAILGLRKILEIPILPEITEDTIEVGLGTLRHRPSLTLVPTMQYGGIVPGPIGRPIPIIAHGGEQFAGAGKGFGNIYNVTFNYDVSLANESEMRKAAQKFLGYIREDYRRTTIKAVI